MITWRTDGPVKGVACHWLPTQYFLIGEGGRGARWAGDIMGGKKEVEGYRFMLWVRRGREVERWK